MVYIPTVSLYVLDRVPLRWPLELMSMYDFKKTLKINLKRSSEVLSQIGYSTSFEPK